MPTCPAVCESPWRSKEVGQDMLSFPWGAQQLRPRTPKSRADSNLLPYCGLLFSQQLVHPPHLCTLHTCEPFTPVHHSHLCTIHTCMPSHLCTPHTCTF